METYAGEMPACPATSAIVVARNPRRARAATALRTTVLRRVAVGDDNCPVRVPDGLLRPDGTGR